MNTRFWVLLISSVLLSSLAQLLLKLGMRGAGKLELSLTSLPTVVLRILTNWYLVAGLASFTASALLWLLVLSRAELSFAYPMVSLGYVFVIILARLVLGEPLTGLRLAGVAAIVAGVVMVGRSG